MAEKEFKYKQSQFIRGGGMGRMGLIGQMGRDGFRDGFFAGAELCVRPSSPALSSFAPIAEMKNMGTVFTIFREFRSPS
jgi:hypothetical protein